MNFMNFQNLSDLELERETHSVVEYLKKGELKLLHLLAEIERRRLYSKKYPSLHAYCTCQLKLSNAVTQIRIDAMRAMKLIPELESKIESGELNLTNIGKAQQLFRFEKKQGRTYNIEERREVFAQIANKSESECIRELVSISPKFIPKEKRQRLTKNETSLRVVVSDELLAKLDQLKALWSHSNPNMTDLELIEKMADLCLKKVDPARKSLRKASGKNSRRVPDVEKRYITAAVKKEVWLRDRGKCTYPGCNSKHLLQYDHIAPYSVGGLSTPENLRLRCQAHNIRAAVEHFGLRKMQTYMNKRT